MIRQQPLVSYWYRIPPAARWTGIVFLTVVLMLIALLSISNWNWARGSIASILSKKLNREVRIEGPLTARLLSLTPAVQVEGLKVVNPGWVKAGDFADIPRLIIAVDLRELFTGDLVLANLEVDNPNISIVRSNDGRNNFDFGADKPKQTVEPPKLPAVRRFTLRGGQLNVIDEPHKLSFVGRVEAQENSAQPEAVPFKLRGHGELNAEPFELVFQGGPLANIKMDEPYEFNSNITAGKTKVVAHGRFNKPFDFAQLTTALDIKGENLAHLYYLTGLALPFTPPYRIAGELRSSEKRIVVHKLDGTVGGSDIQGEITVDLTNERPKLIADLTSRSLNLNDLAPAVGKGVRIDPKTGEPLDSVAPGNLPPDKLLPDFKFEFDRLRTMDADVKLRAASVQTKKVPMESVNFHIKLNDGLLSLDPMVFSLQQGKLAGTVQLDTRQKVAHTKLDIRMSGVKLEQFKGKAMSEPPLSGIVHMRAQLEGKGNSMRDIAATSNGTLTAVLPHGEVRQAFAELTGINVARGLGLLMARDQEKSTVRCGVATFQVQQGAMQAAQVVFDTETVLITVDGDVKLGDEKLNLNIEGKPKKLRLARVRSPVTLRGTLRDPAVGVDVSKVAPQVGIAALLGALFAPLTAALAFIDPGLAKDANCAALLAEAESAMPNKQAYITVPNTK